MDSVAWRGRHRVPRHARVESTLVSSGALTRVYPALKVNLGWAF